MKDEFLKEETWIILHFVKNNPNYYKTQILVSEFKRDHMGTKDVVYNANRPKNPGKTFFHKLEQENLIKEKETPKDLPTKADRREFYSITQKGEEYLEKMSEIFETEYLKKEVKASK